jgi:phosphatidylserine/phosphatidylglycerophosphate/cardiolipin synthase-like enzyme
MKLVREADRNRRFRLLYPVNDARNPIYVHAKIMIIDDQILKLGSANQNNRSMGYDTECDVIIDAPEGRDDIASKNAFHRNGLLAEHLGYDASRIEDELRSKGSLIKAIDALNRTDRRGLVEVPMRELTADEELLAESDIADPERPAGVAARMSSRLRRQAHPHG